MWKSDKWQDYELIDCGGGERLERWGRYILVRPDPQAIWTTPRRNPLWRKANARYARSSSGGGAWEKKAVPDHWQIGYGPLTFNIRNAKRPISVLNLFAYTGGATVSCAAAGASVCHVDAARGMVSWARENAKSSGLEDAPIRYIVDDCGKFVEREIRRGRKYDAVIMDPPSYGRGPSGEVWRLEENLYPFVELVSQVLSDEPLFFLINSYTTGLAPSVLTYILETLVSSRHGGHTVSDELGLSVTETGLVLPAGASGRWTAR